jgi:hypothetical protein
MYVCPSHWMLAFSQHTTGAFDKEKTGLGSKMLGSRSPCWLGVLPGHWLQPGRSQSFQGCCPCSPPRAHTAAGSSRTWLFCAEPTALC